MNLKDDAKKFNALLRQEIRAMCMEMDGVPGNYPEIRPTAWLARCVRMYGHAAFFQEVREEVEKAVDAIMKQTKGGK